MSEEKKLQEGNQEEKKLQEGEKASGKLFTQEEVNAIIKSRLSDRKKEQASDQARIDEAVKAAIAEKEKDLERRSSLLSCREYVLEKGLPPELLETIDTSDFETFKKKAAKISGAYESRNNNYSAPLGSSEALITKGGLSGGFDRARKHTPKKFGGWNVNE